MVADRPLLVLHHRQCERHGARGEGWSWRGGGGRGCEARMGAVGVKGGEVRTSVQVGLRWGGAGPPSEAEAGIRGFAGCERTAGFCP